MTLSFLIYQKEWFCQNPQLCRYQLLRFHLIVQSFTFSFNAGLQGKQG